MEDKINNSSILINENISYKVNCKNGELAIPQKYNKYLLLSKFFKSLIEEYDKQDENNTVKFDINYITVENLELFIEFLSFISFSESNEINLIFNDLLVINDNLEIKKNLPEINESSIMKELFLIKPSLENFYKDVLNTDNVVKYYELSDFLRIPILEYLVMKFIVNSFKKNFEILPTELNKENVEKFYSSIYDQINNLKIEEIEEILKS